MTAESAQIKMEFSDESQIVPLALRRTHRANAGAKRKQAEEESIKAKDKQKEMKKKKKRHWGSPTAAANSAKSVTKMAADFIRSSKTKVPVPKVIKNLHPHNDYYCWVCHNQRRDGNFLYCNVCPRVYHDTCANVPCPQPDWVCLECEKITDAECTETQSNAMASLTVDKLAKVLRTAIEKMKRYTNSLLFTPIDDLREFRDYRQFVYHPMDLSVMEKNVQDRCYGSTEAFLADARWIVHNAFVYFGSGNRYSNAAKALLKACETEMAEVEVCPDCYLGAVYKRAQWFSEVCTKPHPLVWAKLHGFPFWPAKAMKEEDGLIEARFFGQHDRAMIPVHNCFQYSPKIPFPASKKRLTGLNAAIKEAELHIKKLEEKLGTPYKYAPHLTPYDPNKRYTTSSLAVMPDGKVKSLTDAGRNAQMKAKIVENGKEESKKEESKKEESKKEESKKEESKKEESMKEEPKKEETKEMDEKEGEDVKIDSSVASSVENEAVDAKGDTSPDLKMESSVASSVDNEELDVEGDTIHSPMENEYPRHDQVGMEHSYACKDYERAPDEKQEIMKDVRKDQDETFEESEENVVQSQEKEEEEDERADAGDKGSCENEDEESFINSDRKRKLSESCTDQPNKVPRTSSVEVNTLSAEHQADEPHGKDPEKLQSLRPGDTLNEVDSTLSQWSPSAQSKTSSGSAGSNTPANKDNDGFSILPSCLPSLDDLEANVSSSESSSSIPKDDVKSNQSTPRKDTFLLNLSKTIDTCKASLGIEEEEMEEEIADEGGRDDEDGLEDADTTGDETMESEDDEDEKAEKEDQQAGTTLKEKHNMDGRTVESKGMLKLENMASVDSPVASDNGQVATEMEDDVQNDDIAKSKSLEKIECTDKEMKGEPETVDDKMRDEGLAEKGSDATTANSKPSEIRSESTTKGPSGLEMQNESQTSIPCKVKDTPSETSPDKTEEEEDDDDDDDDDDDNDDDDNDDEDGDDDDDEDADGYDGDSSDGALLIDEGGEESASPDKKDDATRNKATAPVSEMTKTMGDEKATPANTDGKKKVIPKDAKPTGAEGKKEEAKDKESSEKEVKKSSGVEGKKVADLSETSKGLLVGAPKAVEKDPDYKELIAKVVDDAVKSIKELEESLADASVDMKKLILDLKREVISLKAKQELQQKELLHCNKLAAAEIRQVMEYNRDSKLNRIKRRYDKQRGDAIFATKAKQWCASCYQEANYFCCWNTSYCSYDCQERHWTRHEKKCQQKSGNFPFVPGPDFDPYRKKKKKKKKKKEEEQAWLREYGIVEEESDDDDPTWEPDPEDFPTMVPRKKTYSSFPASVSRQYTPKVSNLPNSRTVSQHTPNRTWTQPSGIPHPRPTMPTSVPTSMLLDEARQRFQSQMMNAAATINVPTSSKQVYIPGPTGQQNRMPVVGQNVAGGPSLIVNAPQRPVRFVQCPKNDMPKTSNVVYVGAPQATGMQTGVQTGVPAKLTMPTPTGGSGGIQNQGASPMPIRLQMGPNNKIGMSSLVQALGQQSLQQGKYVIQLTPGQQGSNMRTVKVAQMGQPNQSNNMPVVIKNVVGGLPQGQVTASANASGNVVQNIHPVGKKQIMIPRLAPNTATPKRVVISMPSVTNTAGSTITVPPPVAPIVIPKTPIVANIPPTVSLPMAAVSAPTSFTDPTGNAVIAQDSSNAPP